MKNQKIQLDIADAELYAYDYFINICGFKNREGDKFKRLLDLGMKIKERIVDKVDLQAVVSSFDRDILSGNKAQIGDTTFICNAFEQLNQNSIRKIYAYLFTSGTFELADEDPVIEQLYADIWGTAYTDAGLDVLKDYLMADFNRNNAGNQGSDGDTGRKAVMLEPFGPGYFGMEVNQIGSFFEVLDGDKIGVKARTNSLMLPLKSCAGFFVIVDDDTRLPAADCKSCHADHSGCEYCQAVIKNKQ